MLMHGYEKGINFSKKLIWGPNKNLVATPVTGLCQLKWRNKLFKVAWIALTCLYDVDH